MEPKPFASLSSGLLARKGAARPAMRPQGFGQVTGNLEDLGWNDMGFEPPKPSAAPRDADHDGFGEEIVDHPLSQHPTGLTPISSPVHTQQAEIAERLNNDDSDDELDETAELYDPEAQSEDIPVVDNSPLSSPRREPRLRAAPGSKDKAAFTLRLDRERHLRLRLACAVDGRSAQQIVTDALDQLLARMPELDTLAQKAKRKG